MFNKFALLTISTLFMIIAVVYTWHYWYLVIPSATVVMTCVGLMFIIRSIHRLDKKAARVFQVSTYVDGVDGIIHANKE